jgi:twinkle protein
LRDIKKFYIGTDNDEKGDDVAEKIAQRLGRYRCERIVFEGKDAYDDLINEVLNETIYKLLNILCR